MKEGKKKASALSGFFGLGIGRQVKGECVTAVGFLVTVDPHETLGLLVERVLERNHNALKVTTGSSTNVVGNL